METTTRDNSIEELAQKLYEDDGHCGNIYKKASIQMLRFYENKAVDLMETKGEKC